MEKRIKKEKVYVLYEDDGDSYPELSVYPTKKAAQQAFKTFLDRVGFTEDTEDTTEWDTPDWGGQTYEECCNSMSYSNINGPNAYVEDFEVLRPLSNHPILDMVRDLQENGRSPEKILAELKQAKKLVEENNKQVEHPAVK